MPSFIQYPPSCNHFQNYHGNIPQSAMAGGTTSKHDFHDAYSDSFDELIVQHQSWET
jgi:hypothetical protein